MAAPVADPVLRLEQLRELAQSLREAAESGDDAALASLIRERQRLLDRLAADPPAAAASDEEGRTRQALLDDVAALDEETEALLRGQRDRIGSALLAVQSGRRGLQGYGAGGRAGGKVIDERG